MTTEEIQEAQRILGDSPGGRLALADWALSRVEREGTEEGNADSKEPARPAA